MEQLILTKKKHKWAL